MQRKIAFITLLILLPGAAFAQTGAVGGEPHPTCISWWNNECKQGTQKCQYPKQCQVSITGGTSIGHCEKTICVGDSASGLDGKQQNLDKALQALQGILGQALNKLMQGGSPGGGPSQGAPVASGTENPYQTASTTSSIFGAVQNISGTIATGANEAQNTVNDILSSVFGGAVEVPAANNSGATSNSGTGVLIESTEGTGGTSSNTSVGASGATTTNVTGAVTEGVSGVTEKNSEFSETRTSDTEVTFEAGIKDVSANSEVSGFYGNTGGSKQESTSLAGRLCSARPWATGIISKLIKPTFFDGLCERFGYEIAPVITTEAPAPTTASTNTEEKNAQIRIEETQEGRKEGEPGMTCTPNIVRPGTEVALSFNCGDGQKITGVAGFSIANNAVKEAVASPTQSTQYAVRCSDEKIYSCSVQVVNPKVSVWADPQEVQLGSRTVMHWQSQDVKESTCVVVGPSFSERGSFGAASTVPINDPSTFTITCEGLDGITTTGNTTVELAI